jgi:hypothetical protein
MVHFPVEQPNMSDDKKTRTKAEKKIVTKVPEDPRPEIEHNRVLPLDLPTLPQYTGVKTKPTVVKPAVPSTSCVPLQETISALIAKELQKMQADVPFDYEEEYPEEYEETMEWDPYGFGEYEDPGEQGLVPFDDYTEQDPIADPALLLAARRAVQAAAAIRALPEATRAQAGIEPELQEVPNPDDEGAYEDLLGGHVSQYEEHVGPPLITKLATHVVNIWSKGKDVTKIKEISERQPVPQNIPLRPTEINPEIVPNLGRFGIARDRRLKAIHALIMRTLTPVMKIANSAMKPATLVRKELLDDALDAVALLSNTSASINFIRRDAARAKLGPKGRNLCPQDQVVHTSNLLLGEDLPSKIKTTSQQMNLLRGSGYQTRFRGGANRYQPYNRGLGFFNRRGRGF